jgi:hypothetical protein
MVLVVVVGLIVVVEVIVNAVGVVLLHVCGVERLVVITHGLARWALALILILVLLLLLLVVVALPLIKIAPLLRTTEIIIIISIIVEPD